MGVLRYFAGMQPPEGPPVWAALKALPFGMPPPMSNTSSPRVMPMGTSTRPVFTTLPERAKTLVPLLFSVPIAASHSGPLLKMWRTVAKVSTLLMIVGLPQRPRTAGKGGLGRGCPRLPSMEAISAVSSPQTKAPAPMRISMSKSKSVSNIRLPRKPMARACSRATESRAMARGYSART